MLALINDCLKNRHFLSVIVCGWSLLLSSSSLYGVIEVTGDTTPDNSALFWSNGGNSATNGTIGSGSAGGTLTVNGGSLLALQNADITNSGVGPVSTATVTGIGSQWNMSQGIRVGNEGMSSLTISNGGLVTNSTFQGIPGPGRSVIAFGSGSTGSVTVTGSGSQWLNRDPNNTATRTSFDVGTNGNGSLLIEAGGLVSNDDGIIARNASSTSTVMVTGMNSTWDNSDLLNIGQGGTGTLNVEDGGFVTSRIATIGGNAGSNGTLTVNGSGSVLETEILTVANNGTGTLYVEAGGVVTVNTNFFRVVAAREGSVGVIEVTGAGSELNYAADQLFLGNRGVGTLLVAEGGEINLGANQTIRLGETGTATGTLQIGDGGAAGIVNSRRVETGAGTGTIVFNHTNSGYYFSRDGTASSNGVIIENGTVILHEGSWETIFTANSTHDGGITISAGTVRITDVGNGFSSAALGTGPVTVEAGGTLAGEGTVLGVTEVSGTLSPGNSPGTLRFATNLVLESTATTFIEIESLTSFDQIEVDGNITYGGELLIGFFGGYVPVIGDSFQIFEAPNVIGGMTFTDLRFQQSGFGGTFDASNGTLDITAVPESAATWLIALGAALTLLRRRRRS
ncbi:MAG: PEP-CTERM sorting domain-containing protein [Verrucomicrobiota bacterium]